MKSTIAIALASVLLAACAPDADTPMHKQASQVTSNPRIQVTRVGVIEDRLAYNERRGLYIIKDTKTGKEYIGVSGIGITEVGSHQSGKTSHEDIERQISVRGKREGAVPHESGARLVQHSHREAQGARRGRQERRLSDRRYSMQTYIGTGAGVIEVNPDAKDDQVIFNKDTVEVIADAGGPLKAGVVFTVTSEGAMQTKTFDIFFQDKPGAGAIGFSDEAVVAILCHRMRLKHAETGNDQWLTAAKYLEDVEESIQVAMKA